VVSTGLRPWIDLDVALLDIQLTEQEARLRFRLTLMNSGAGGARDIVVEAFALNAGESQERSLQPSSPDRRPRRWRLHNCPALERPSSSMRWSWPRGAIREYMAQGRRLFVPCWPSMPSYRWSGGMGRTGAAFLTGHEVPGSDRLAPLRLDGSAKRLTGLGGRRLKEQVRR
jgi:hypothetical protein